MLLKLKSPVVQVSTVLFEVFTKGIARLFRFQILAFLGMIIAMTASAVGDETEEWFIETAASTNTVHVDIDMAVDQAGRIHIIHRSIPHELKYTTNASGTWVTRTVASDLSTIDRPAAIAVDSTGQAHIVYVHEWGINYTTPDGNPETIDADGVGHVSIAVDSSDYLHVSYHFSDPEEESGLGYATNTSGWWILCTVDTGWLNGLYTSIAVDSSDHVHISYFNDKEVLSKPPGSLKYATNASGSWRKENVSAPQGASAGVYSDITVGLSGKVYISYHQYYLYEYQGETEVFGWLRCAMGSYGSWMLMDADKVYSEDTYGDPQPAQVGLYCSIALDSTGRAHICHYDASYPTLRYVVNDADHPQQWENRTVDASFDVGQYSSIAIDPSDRVHIGYLDAENRHLKYAINRPLSWRIETVDDDGNTGRCTSVKAWPENEVHISYLNQTNRHLKYALKVSDSWQIETVDESGDVGLYKTSLGVDSSGNAHISYDRNCYPRHVVRRPESGLWSPELVSYSLSGCATGETALAVDTSDYWHIIFYDYVVEESRNTLKYATNHYELGNYVVPIETSDTETFRSCDLVVDSSGQAHIVYVLGGKLKYATDPDGYREPWSIETIDDSGVGGQVSIALGPSEDLNVSYFNHVDHDLRYAIKYRAAPTAWITELVDGRGIVGEWSSIAVDQSGEVHISYYDRTHKALKYATEQQTWRTETVDIRGLVGTDTSIAVDENYKVHISYYDWTNGALKHAWKSLPTNPRIAISPQSYDFGTVRLGSPRSVEIILSNYGTADLIISDMDLSNEDDFSLDVDGGSNPAGSTNPQIVPGEERSVVIVFDPSTIGLSYDATLTIFSNDPTYPEVEIELSGNAFPGTGDGVCFIATAAYGSPVEPRVRMLRRCRDRFLVNNAIGKRLLDPAIIHRLLTIQDSKNSICIFSMLSKLIIR